MSRGYYVDDDGNFAGWADEEPIYTEEDVRRISQAECDALLARVVGHVKRDVDDYESRVRREIWRMENGYHND